MSRGQRTGILAVASHLWGSPVHAAAAALIDPHPGDSIVDLGAGFGAATLHLAQRVGPDGRVVAVDPSRIMRGAFRARRAVHSTRQLVDVRDGTAERLPVPDRSIDAVLAMNVIHLLHDVDAAATELDRAMRPGGRILFVEEDLDDPAHRFHQSEPHGKDGPTVDDLAGALDRAGLLPKIERRHLGAQPVTLVTASTTASS